MKLELGSCECDNTHHQNDTVCRWCWEFGCRKWDDVIIGEVGLTSQYSDIRSQAKKMIFKDGTHTN